MTDAVGLEAAFCKVKVGLKVEISRGLVNVSDNSPVSISMEKVLSVAAVTGDKKPFIVETTHEMRTKSQNNYL